MNVAGSPLANLLGHGVAAAVTVLASLFSGAVMTPLLLPWIPTRAFSSKGALVGAVMVTSQVTFLRRLAPAAGALARDYWVRRASLVVEAKGPQDFVSRADRDVEAFIRAYAPDASPDIRDYRVRGDRFDIGNPVGAVPPHSTKGNEISIRRRDDNG